MKFKVYPKIQAIHKEECEGLLIGKCYIQEKVDGANASIWLESDEQIHYGSRSRDLFLANDNFNGFGDWVKNHKQLKEFFITNPFWRLNGEWLVRHSIKYKELNYKQFYLFDIETPEGTLPLEKMYSIAMSFDIPTVHLFATIENPSVKQIKEYVGTSVLGLKGEGVVVKNLQFVNKFGENQFGKYVTQEFKEDNAITFGGNNKTSDSYYEMYFINKYMTLARVQKVFNKLTSAESKLSEKDIPRVMGTCFHDLMAEEGFSIAKEMATKLVKFDFKAFKQLCDRKSRSIFLELLTGDVSVAHFHNVSDKESYEQNNIN